MKYVLFLILLAGCTKKSTPEATLIEFIGKRFAGSADKSYVLEWTTGQLRAEMEAMSDADYKTYQDVEDVKKDKVRIITKRCDEAKCFITYSVDYSTYSEQKLAFKTETKKVAELIKEGEDWKISSITHIKTYHDSQNAINPMSEN